MEEARVIGSGIYLSDLSNVLEELRAADKINLDTVLTAFQSAGVFILWDCYKDILVERLVEPANLCDSTESVPEAETHIFSAQVTCPNCGRVDDHSPCLKDVTSVRDYGMETRFRCPHCGAEHTFHWTVTRKSTL